MQAYMQVDARVWHRRLCIDVAFAVRQICLRQHLLMRAHIYIENLYIYIHIYIYMRNHIHTVGESNRPASAGTSMRIQLPGILVLRVKEINELKVGSLKSGFLSVRSRNSSGT